MNGKISDSDLYWKIILKAAFRPPLLRQHIPNLFLLPRYRANVGRYSPIVIMCNIYSCLHAKNFSSRDLFCRKEASFKTLIRKFS